MSQIQQSSDRTLMDEAIALTAAQPSQIKSFLNANGLTLDELMQDESALELLAQQSTAQPSEALSSARTQIDAQLENIALQIDDHLTPGVWTKE